MRRCLLAALSIRLFWPCPAAPFTHFGWGSFFIYPICPTSSWSPKKGLPSGVTVLLGPLFQSFQCCPGLRPLVGS